MKSKLSFLYSFYEQRLGFKFKFKLFLSGFSLSSFLFKFFISSANVLSNKNNRRGNGISVENSFLQRKLVSIFDVLQTRFIKNHFNMQPYMY